VDDEASARAARVARAAVLALAALAACGSVAAVPGADPTTDCRASHMPMPRANIGPDVTLRVICGSTATAAVASVDQTGPGTTAWSTSIEGDQAYTLVQSVFFTCAAGGPSVAIVELTVPPDAVPGDTFDAVVDVHADDGSFSPAKVNVHAVVTVPVFTLEPTALDFGDVSRMQSYTRLVTVADDDPVDVNIVPNVDRPNFFFSVIPSVTPHQKRVMWQVHFEAYDLGDDSATATWTAGPSYPPGCATVKTMPLHARVVPDAGPGDGGATDLSW
jgi:hypothetical protein